MVKVIKVNGKYPFSEVQIFMIIKCYSKNYLIENQYKDVDQMIKKWK